MTENIQDLTVEKAKAQIQENTQLKDLGNKTFDDLSANEIQTLGTNVAGTIVLLHKLAGRDGNEKLEAPDVSS